jgi:hypothetical protein
MANNPLKYTGLTYSEIMNQIQALIASDARFDNFRETAIAQLVFEIFSSCVDLCNYNVERSAEESFFQTQLRRSSSILLATNLFYDVRRPIPSVSTLNVTIEGNMVGKITAGTKINIPVFTKIKYIDINLIFTKSFIYTFTADDVTEIINQGDDYKKVITVDDDGDPISVCEGEIKEKIIEGSSNLQINQIFQRYRIPDTAFSDKYGENDFDYFPVTRVWVGDSKSPENEFKIDRNSLLNDDVVDAITNKESVKSCLIRTSKYEDVEILFGNARINELGAQIGAQEVDLGGGNTALDNIYIQYLSTKGSSVSQVGIINEKLVYSNQIILSNYQDITSNVTFMFNTNLVGGSDLEDIDSIKVNAPNYFYSMRRVVNDRDYNTFLKTITDPISIINALAWGEQEECDARGLEAILELYNVILFSCMGTLYITDGDINTATYGVRSKGNRLEESVLDLDFNEDGMSSQCYFNLYTKNQVVKQLKEYVVYNKRFTFNNLGQVLDMQWFNFVSKYSTDTSIPFKINSFKYATNLVEDKTISVNFSDVTEAEGMNGIAYKIQTELRTVIDTRSRVLEGSETNGNLNNPAFPNVVVVWNDINKKFVITFDVNDPCYISQFYYEAEVYDIVDDLGFYNVASSIPYYSVSEYTNTNMNLISGAIIDVLAKLNKRSQLTPKNVYLTPIIQSFKLVGDVYVNKLYDTDKSKQQVNNVLYKHLDTNTDYNSSISLGNLVGKIKESINIDSCNVKLEPLVPVPDKYKTFFHSKTILDVPAIGEYQPIDGQGDDALAIYQSFYYCLSSFFGQSLTNNNLWENFIQNLSSYSGLKNNLNERMFITELMKIIYDDLVVRLGPSISGNTKFQDKTEFLTVMSDIHKDVCWLIRNNMMDDSGNIDAQYETVNNDYGIPSKNYIKGGYSIGSEIPKISLEMNYIYK